MVATVPWRFPESCVLYHFSDAQSLSCFFISFKFLGVILEVAFFIISRMINRSPVLLYLLHVPWRFPGSCVLYHFSDAQSLSCFSVSFKFLGVILEVAFFIISRMLNCSPILLYLLHVPWRFPGSSFCIISRMLNRSPVFFISFMFLGVFLEVAFCIISRMLNRSSIFLSPSSSLALSWKLRSLSFLGCSIALLFFYLLQVPWRYPGSCVLYHFSDAQSLSCFFISLMFLGVFLEVAFCIISRMLNRSSIFLSPSSSLALSWKLRSLSFLGCSIALLFFYLLQVPWRFPGSCVLYHFSDAQSLFYFFISFKFLGVILEVAFFIISRMLNRSPIFLSPSCSLAFSWKLRSLLLLCPSNISGATKYITTSSRLVVYFVFSLSAKILTAFLLSAHYKVKDSTLVFLFFHFR